MFRSDIDRYINTNIASFKPYRYDTVDDEELWNSSNPMGAMMHINMTDDGTVVVTEFRTDRCTMATIILLRILNTRLV